MDKSISVAETKRRFSELMGRVVFSGERFVIERSGKPMAALVSIEDLKTLSKESQGGGRRGLLAAVGAWEDFENLDVVINEICQSRKKAKDRLIEDLN